MTRFDDCLKIVLEYEGGYSDVPGDRGGKTKWGITQNTLDRWCYISHHDKVIVANLTEVQRDNIYQLLYWQPPCCYDLPHPLDLVIFDAAVNHGPQTAIKLLQAQLGVTVDGIVGRNTMRHAKDCNARRIALAVIGARRAKYTAIAFHDASQQKFLKGWQDRMDKLTTEVSK